MPAYFSYLTFSIKLYFFYCCRKNSVLSNPLNRNLLYVILYSDTSQARYVDFTEKFTIIVLLKLGELWWPTFICTLLEAVIGTGIYFFVLLILRDRMVFELLGYVVQKNRRK